jgi:hypothetical protein
MPGAADDPARMTVLLRIGGLIRIGGPPGKCQGSIPDRGALQGFS